MAVTKIISQSVFGFGGGRLTVFLWVFIARQTVVDDRLTDCAGTELLGLLLERNQIIFTVANITMQ